MSSERCDLIRPTPSISGGVECRRRHAVVRRSSCNVVHDRPDQAPNDDKGDQACQLAGTLQLGEHERVHRNEDRERQLTAGEVVRSQTGSWPSGGANAERLSQWG